MYSNLIIRNFRCFKELRIEGLKAINLITGMNDVGKTSCLEALFLLVGGFNPGLPLRINALRGLDTVVPNAEEFWGWLFHNQDLTQTIEIIGSLPDSGEDALRVQLGTPRDFELLSKGEQELPVSNSGPRSGFPIEGGIPSTNIPTQFSDLILEFSEHRGRSVISRASVTPDGRIKLEQPQQNGFRPGAFLATRIRLAAEDAARLSQLKRTKRDDQVIKALKTIEPEIRDLTILVAGGQSVIHAEVADGRLLPMALLGEGIGRLLSLTLAVLTSPNGLVLVDEIENGIHHSVLTKVWKGLAVAAEQAKTQIIATTHSSECLSAAHEALSPKSEYPLSVIQLFRLPQGIQGRVLDREHIQAAMAGAIDLR